MSLIDKLSKVGSVSGSAIMSESKYFTGQDMITTKLPILNIAFSGDMDGGIVPGLTIVAGASKSFKSALSLFCMKAYMDKYPDAVVLFYDTEFGITNDYLASFDIDPTRILHIPVEHVEQLKFDVVKKVESLARGDRVFILVDSIGQISSKKEVDDAADEKSVADMTRAKSIRSLLRLLTLQLTKKDIPCIMVNHIYQTQEMYSKVVIPGGAAVMYSANTVFVISRVQEKDADGELSGYKFNINIEKSRYIKEKSKLPLNVSFENGINKWSGMLDLALESGHIIKPKNGWYAMVNTETGEISDKNVRAAATQSEDFLGKILATPSFKKFIIDKYKLSTISGNFSDEDIDADLAEIDTEL